MEVVGCYLGCMYQMGCKQFFIYCLIIGLNEYFIELCKLFEDVILIFFGLKVVFLKVIDELIVVVIVYWWEDFIVLWLYGDCYVGNIFWCDGLMFVDLDDVCNGLVVQDLWMLFNGDKVEQWM